MIPFLHLFILITCKCNLNTPLNLNNSCNNQIIHPNKKAFGIPCVTSRLYCTCMKTAKKDNTVDYDNEDNNNCVLINNDNNLHVIEKEYKLLLFNFDNLVETLSECMKCSLEQKVTQPKEDVRKENISCVTNSRTGTVTTCNDDLCLCLSKEFVTSLLEEKSCILSYSDDPDLNQDDLGDDDGGDQNNINERCIEEEDSIVNHGCEIENIFSKFASKHDFEYIDGRTYFKGLPQRPFYKTLTKRILLFTILHHYRFLFYQRKNETKEHNDGIKEEEHKSRPLLDALHLGLSEHNPVPNLVPFNVLHDHQIQSHKDEYTNIISLQNCC